MNKAASETNIDVKSSGSAQDCADYDGKHMSRSHILRRASMAAKPRKELETRQFEAPPIFPRETTDNFKPHYTLTSGQQELLNQFRSKIIGDPTLTEKQKNFVTDPCLCRYLRAREWQLGPSEALLRSTLQWRETFGVDSLDPAGSIEAEMVTGKIVLHGLDRLGRPILWMRPRYQNTKDYAGQTRHTVFMIERALRSTNPIMGVEQLLLVLDFKGYSLRTAPPLSQCREILTILMDHYPERLGNALILNAPVLFSLTWNALRPFLPPETKKKVLFLGGNVKESQNKQHKIASLIDMDIVPAEDGGQYSYVYNHELYWGLEKTLWQQSQVAVLSGSVQ